MVKVRRELLLGYFIEGTPMDIFTKGIVWEKSVDLAISDLLFANSNTGNFKLALHLIIYVWTQMHQQCCDQWESRTIYDIMRRPLADEFGPIMSECWRHTPSCWCHYHDNMINSHIRIMQIKWHVNKCAASMKMHNVKTLWFIFQCILSYYTKTTR